jgi:hypothetical protein
MYVKFSTSKRDDKKYTAQFFDNDDGDIVKTTHFGQRGASDFTKHKDTERKNRYLARHQKRENWNDFKSAAGLSRWILWNKPSLNASIDYYIKKFGLKLKK